jgi:hypothetical protein
MVRPPSRRLTRRYALAARATLGALALAALPALAGPIGYTAWDVSGNDKLVRMDLATGVGTVVGTNIGFTDIDGLAFNAAGQLYGVNDDTNQLVRIDTNTGVGTAVGAGFGNGFNDMGLAFGGNGTLYMASTGSGVGRLYTVDTGTGVATSVGSFGNSLLVRSLGFYGGKLYGWSNIDTLLDINTSTGAATTLGSFNFVSPTIGQDGMDADPATGLLWSIAEVENRTYTINRTTGAATVRATALTCDGGSCAAGGFNSLAIASAVPEPGSFALTGLGLLGLGLSQARRRRTPSAAPAA